jgi:hypothetical protein
LADAPSLAARPFFFRGTAMKIYPASKARWARHWCAVRSLLGLPITGSWIDWDRNKDGSEPTVAEWRDHWQRCLAEARDCDVLLFVDMPGENQCGAIAEMGSALGAGKQVFIVSENWWSIEHYDNVRKFSRIEDAVTALVSMHRDQNREVNQMADIHYERGDSARASEHDIEITPEMIAAGLECLYDLPELLGPSQDELGRALSRAFFVMRRVQSAPSTATSRRGPAGQGFF